MLAGLAIHCDKYDFVKALRPWVPLWFEKVHDEKDKSTQLGYLALAAYIFWDERQFAKISKKAMLQLLASEWDLFNQLELLRRRVVSLDKQHVGLWMQASQNDLDDTRVVG
jgi:hypothetical protein